LGPTGELTVLPQTSSPILGGPTSKGGEGNRRGQRVKGVRKREGRDKLGKGGEGKGDKASPN